MQRHESFVTATTWLCSGEVNGLRRHCKTATRESAQFQDAIGECSRRDYVERIPRVLELEATSTPTCQCER